MDKKDLQKILEAIQKAYKAAGKEIVTAELYQPGEEEPEILIAPKKKPEELN